MLERSRDVCFMDRNGKLRKPNGQYATTNDVKRINAERYARQLADWAKRQGVKVKVGK